MGAVAFAVVAIVVALAVRGGDGDGASVSSTADGSFDPGDDVYDAFEDDEVSLVCIEELRLLCEDAFPSLGFDVRIESVWTTVDRLEAGGALDADAWLTVRPFDDLARAAGADLLPSSAVLARSPIAIIGSKEAVTAFDATCGDATVLLTCAATDGRADVVLRDPATSAIGALALASVADELGATTERLPGTVETIEALLADGRIAQVPYEDAERAGGTLVALTIEAELLAAIEDLTYEEQDVYDDAAIRYPLDVRAVEVVAVTGATAMRAQDVQAVLASEDVGYSYRRTGYTVDGDASYLLDYAVPFADRPTVRTDLPPPSVELLQALRGGRR